MAIPELPDYAALQQIAKALWKQGKTRGAAVLVGAGFSRNAQLLHAGGSYPSQRLSLIGCEVGVYRALNHPGR